MNEKIEELRKELSRLVIRKGSYKHPEVVKKSEEMDRLIKEEMEKKRLKIRKKNCLQSRESHCLEMS